jgi:hypothetical protein
MSESDYIDVNGDGYADHVEYEEYGDGSAAALVDLNADGRPDVAFYDANGDGYIDQVIPAEGTGSESGYESGYDSGHQSAPAYADSGNFYANDNLGTAVSSNPGGQEGYIALGDGEFVSWG